MGEGQQIIGIYTINNINIIINTNNVIVRV